MAWHILAAFHRLDTDVWAGAGSEKGGWGGGVVGSLDRYAWSLPVQHCTMGTFPPTGGRPEPPDSSFRSSCIHKVDDAMEAALGARLGVKAQDLPCLLGKLQGVGLNC